MRLASPVLGVLAAASLATLLAAVSFQVVLAEDAAQKPAPAPGAADASPTIDWQPSLVAAFEAAKKENKPLFIAINADKVNGKSGMEPAAKELRENTYLDASVIKKSREFVCALVKPEANSADYGELRGRFAIDGIVVSPQHIFARPDGTLLGERHEYWSYGLGAASVEAMLALMDQALSMNKTPASSPASGAGGTPEERATWIKERCDKVKDHASEATVREMAAKDLIKADQKGDCVTPLCAALLEIKKDGGVRLAIVRSLGKPRLDAAVPALVTMLDEKEDELRSNVAVTLEYIGSASAVDGLTKRIGKEKDDFTFNNLCRALGHCGSKLEAARKTLLKEFTSNKSTRTAAGPAIGLAYFEKDADAARGIEKVLATGGEWQKRTFGLYALTEIHDPKSADFVREKIQKNEKNPMALIYINNVVSALSGDEGGTAKEGVGMGVGFAIGNVGGVGGDARKDRDQSEFKPKGEFSGRGPGGGMGPGGGTGMGG